MAKAIRPSLITYHRLSVVVVAVEFLVPDVVATPVDVVLPQPGLAGVGLVIVIVAVPGTGATARVVAAAALDRVAAGLGEPATVASAAAVGAGTSRARTRLAVGTRARRAGSSARPPVEPEPPWAGPKSPVPPARVDPPMPPPPLMVDMPPPPPPGSTPPLARPPADVRVDIVVGTVVPVAVNRIEIVRVGKAVAVEVGVVVRSGSVEGARRVQRGLGEHAASGLRVAVVAGHVARRRRREFAELLRLHSCVLVAEIRDDQSQVAMLLVQVGLVFLLPLGFF